MQRRINIPAAACFYTKAAVRMGLTPPVFTSKNEGEGKWITNEFVKSDLGYTFLHPDPDKFVNFTADT